MHSVQHLQGHPHTHRDQDVVSVREKGGREAERWGEKRSKKRGMTRGSWKWRERDSVVTVKR